MRAPVRVELVEHGIDWLSWISAGAAVATLAIVGVTAWFARNQLKDAQRTRHSQLFLSLSDQWAGVADSLSLYWKYPRGDLADLIDRLYGAGDEQASPEDLADFQALRSSINLAETVGVLREDKAITTSVIYDLWGGTIYSLWLSWEDALPRLRGHTGEPDLLLAFERLARDIAEKMQQRAPGRRAPRGGATEEASESRAGADAARGNLASSAEHSGSVVRRVLALLGTLLTLSVVVWFLDRRARS